MLTGRAKKAAGPKKRALRPCWLRMGLGCKESLHKTSWGWLEAKKKTSSMVFMLKVLLIGGIRRQGQARVRQ